MKNWNISDIQQEEHSNELKKMILEYVTKNALDSNFQTQINGKRIDPYTKNLLVYLFTGTRGGTNRLRSASAN